MLLEEALLLVDGLLLVEELLLVDGLLKWSFKILTTEGAVNNH